jgi:hypothetical protein
MIGSLASRQASRSLQTVIVMLLLPLLIFGTIYFQKSRATCEQMESFAKRKLLQIQSVRASSGRSIDRPML